MAVDDDDAGHLQRRPFVMWRSTRTTPPTGPGRQFKKNMACLHTRLYVGFLGLSFLRGSDVGVLTAYRDAGCTDKSTDGRSVLVDGSYPGGRGRQLDK